MKIPPPWKMKARVHNFNFCFYPPLCGYDQERDRSRKAYRGLPLTQGVAVSRGSQNFCSKGVGLKFEQCGWYGNRGTGPTTNCTDGTETVESHEEDTDSTEIADFVRSFFSRGALQGFCEHARWQKSLGVLGMLRLTSSGHATDACPLSNYGGVCCPVLLM